MNAFAGAALVARRRSVDHNDGFIVACAPLRNRLVTWCGGGARLTASDDEGAATSAPLWQF